MTELTKEQQDGLEHALALVKGSEMPLDVAVKSEEEAELSRRFIKGRRGAGNITIVVEP